MVVMIEMAPMVPMVPVAVMPVVSTVSIVMIVSLPPVAAKRDVVVVVVVFPMVANPIGCQEPIASFPFTGPIATVADVTFLTADSTFPPVLIVVVDLLPIEF